MKTKGVTIKNRYKVKNLYLTLITVTLIGLLLSVSKPVLAQTGSAVSSVTVSNSNPDIGNQVVATINIDLSGVNAPDNALGSYTGVLNWNTSILQYQSYSGAPPAGFTGTVNTASTGSGQLTFNGANASGASGNTVILSITFNVVGAGITALDLSYSVMSAATTFADLLGILTVNDDQVDVAGPAGSIAYLGTVGSVYNNSSGTSLNIPLSSSVAIGNTIILGFGSRGASTYNEPTVSDAAGNTYHLASVAVTYSHGRSYIYYAYIEYALASGQNITITTSSVASRVAVAAVFSGIASINPLDQALGNPTLESQSTAQGNSPSVGPTGTTSQANELIIGMIATEEATDAGTGTWLNSFITGPQQKTSGASYEWRISMGYLIASSQAQFTAAKTVTNNPYWAAAIATFKTISTLSPDAYNILLGRPTNNSITASTIMDQNGEIYFEYGTSTGNYSAGQSGILAATANVPVKTLISGLNFDTKYYYRLLFRPTGQTIWLPGEEFSFHTQRANNETFTFTIISDSHLGDTFSNNTPERYNQTTLNVAADHADFHLDLGDAFIMADPINQTQANTVYANQRPYFGNFSHSSPVFLAIGNHENEEGWNLDDTPFSKALGSIKARKQYFCNPIPDAFYSGNTDQLAAIGGDEYREDYYSWEWGDALFIVLDPFQYTMTKPYGNITGSGEDNDETVSGDQWNWTLGLEQFNWFKETLENSNAKYKFVFSHHVTGGILNVSGGAGTPAYVRGGAEAASYFEWGGKNADGTDGFSTKRSGWGDNPIHQLMIANGVSAYFHGHDHQYVHEFIDGIHYQLVPSPGMLGYGFDLYDGSSYVVTGGNLPDPGHLRVTVSSNETLVEYVQAEAGGGGVNGDVVDSYTIEPSQQTSSISVTSPNGGEDWQVSSSHNITWTSTGTSGNVKIEYSINNGSDWIQIIASTPDNGSYQWIIPDAPSSNCLIRITDTEGTPVDQSNSVFTISPVPVLDITSPNGGEDWQTGSSHDITWTSVGTSGTVKLEYSINNGSGWIVVIASTADDGSYSWTIPDNPSVNCLVRVSDTDGDPSDQSSAVFTISSAPVINVSSPNGGENFVVGTNHDITWTSLNTSGTVRIEYSVNNGTDWTEIIASTSDDGLYAWTIPDNPSTSCLVRISDTDGTPTDQSDAMFTIAPVPVINITSPNGGEDWQVGSIHNINWTSEGIGTNIRIEYSTDNGTSWNDIIASTQSDGLYEWTIPNEPSTECLVRISGTEGDPSDLSDATFSISIEEGNHFTPIWGGNGFDHMNFYALTATLDGTDLQPGDEIGIFDGTLCVGSGMLTQVLNGTNYLEIRVSADDPSTPQTDGYTSGHSASFRLWDVSEQKEIQSVTITYEEDQFGNPYNNIFTPGASCWYHIDGVGMVEQMIPLSGGWNILSLNVIPDNIDMMHIVQPLIDAGALVKVQDEKGAALELIPGGPWNNNIGDWSIGEGYKIRVNTSIDLIVTGTPITGPVDISLQTGWNVISYPGSSPQDAMAILDDLILSGTLVKVQDQAGNAIELIPNTTTWINNIHDFLPGQGYKIRVSADDILTINPMGPGKKGSLISTSVPHVSEYYRPTWEGNGYDHMNVYLTDNSNNESGFKPGDEIGIFDGSLCVGSGIIMNAGEKYYSFVASADDPTTTEIDGFIEGHPLILRIWRPEANTEAYIEKVEFINGSDHLFKPMGTAAIKINTSALTLSHDYEVTTSLGDNYPNPFSNETIIPFEVGIEGIVDISVYDILGKKLTTIVHGSLQTGRYTARWNATDERKNRISSGIYICKMIAGSKVYVNKIIVK